MLIIADSKIPNAKIAFAQFGEVHTLPTPEIRNPNIQDADILLVRSETRVDKQLLVGSRVRFVGTATIGIDHVDAEFLKHSNIGFASCPGSNANSVAEYVLAALLEVGARFRIALKGTTLAVIGHGNTGSRVAKKAEAIGMKVLLNDPPLARATGDPRYLPLDAVMDADFVSLHVPLTKTGNDATVHLFASERLGKMKRGSILINTARGAVVETEGLKNALASDHLRACVLDVWEGEPTIDVELLRSTAIGTPHIAGYSYDGKVNATMMLKRSLGEFLKSPAIEDINPSGSPLKSITLFSHECRDESVRSVVQQCYDILLDDRNLRILDSVESGKRADYFRRLRADYAIRREFHNYAIDRSALSSSCAKMFDAIGFVIK